MKFLKLGIEFEEFAKIALEAYNKVKEIKGKNIEQIFFAADVKDLKE